MTYIDTHCHLYDEVFDTDRDDALDRALHAGVDTMLLPDIDSSSTPRLLQLAAAHPQHFRTMAGLHPTSVNDNYEQELAHVRQQLLTASDHRSSASGSPLVAIGEIGLDFYWDRTFACQQQEALRTQLVWAEEYNLPVCLHVRKAHNELFALLRELNRASYRGVMHCFGGSVQEALRAVEMGFCLGIGGVVTFKNATLAEVVKAVPLESLLLETDAPYLAPVPHRGHRNEPAYVPIVAQRIADLRDIPLQQVAEVTTASATALFRL